MVVEITFTVEEIPSMVKLQLLEVNTNTHNCVTVCT